MNVSCVELRPRQSSNASEYGFAKTAQASQIKIESNSKPPSSCRGQAKVFAKEAHALVSLLVVVVGRIVSMTRHNDMTTMMTHVYMYMAMPQKTSNATHFSSTHSRSQTEIQAKLRYGWCAVGCRRGRYVLVA